MCNGQQQSWTAASGRRQWKTDGQIWNTRTDTQSPAVNHMANGPIRRRRTRWGQGIVEQSLTTGPTEPLLALGIALLAVEWCMHRRRQTVGRRRQIVASWWSQRTVWLQCNTAHHRMYLRTAPLYLRTLWRYTNAVIIILLLDVTRK